NIHFKMKEDTRLLKEFYPDATARHRVHSGFAHQFLPQYVQQNPYAFLSYVFRQDMPGGAMEPTRFIQSRWSSIFEEWAGLAPKERPGEPMVFRRVSDLSMSVHSVAGRPTA